MESKAEMKKANKSIMMSDGTCVYNSKPKTTKEITQSLFVRSGWDDAWVVALNPKLRVV
jgi:hypothetical protein